MELDKISVERLEVFANHGVFDFEKENGQLFYVSVDMFLFLKKAGDEDNLNESVNYGEVCETIRQVMGEKSYNLIEAAAENIAKEILCKYKKIEKLTVKLSKPHAPIDMNFDDVSVTIHRERHTAYISIGSNIGDKKSYLDFGIEKLNELKECNVTRVSDFIVTEPYGGVEQDEFLNGCIEVKTLLEPEKLLRELNKIEALAMRERKIHWGPRTLDLDIIFFDDIIYHSDTLIIPHADFKHRLFVLKPLMQIAPHFIDPVSKKTVSELYKRI